MLNTEKIKKGLKNTNLSKIKTLLDSYPQH